MCRWILVVFGKNVSRKVGNGHMYNFPPRLTGVFALFRKTGTTENVPLPSMLCATLLTNTQNTLSYLPISLLYLILPACLWLSPFAADV